MKHLPAEISPKQEPVIDGLVILGQQVAIAPIVGESSRQPFEFSRCLQLIAYTNVQRMPPPRNFLIEAGNRLQLRIYFHRLFGLLSLCKLLCPLILSFPEMQIQIWPQPLPVRLFPCFVRREAFWLGCHMA